MNKQEKKEVIDYLKDKFTAYSHFYITDTESLSVAQVNNLRKKCHEKNIEMKVAKNVLIKQALESLDKNKYAKVIPLLHYVSALMFTQDPKEPAVIIGNFKKEFKNEKPVLKVAFVEEEVYVGNEQLAVLQKIKTKKELVADLVYTLQSTTTKPINALQSNAGQKVAALLNALEKRTVA